MKKRQKTQTPPRRIRAIRKSPYPDNDPEWEHLEERYSQIDGSSMKQLAEMLSTNNSEPEFE